MIGPISIPREQAALVPHSRPYVGREEAEAVAAVVRSRHVAQGERVYELEQRWCAATGMAQAAAVGSGLGALRLALTALGVTKNDEVVVPAYSCVALANAVLAVGATPRFVDVEPNTWVLAAEAVRRRISPRTCAIVAVHQFGYPAPIAALRALGVPVVEDCAHGVGGHTAGTQFGGAGDISIASFHASKMICGAEGGMVAAHAPPLVERVRTARGYADQAPSADRLNDKMSDVHAALALVQLQRLPEMLRVRSERAKRYHRLLQPLVETGQLQLPATHAGRIWYRYAVRVEQAAAKQVCRHMQEHGIMAEQPVYDLRESGWCAEDVPAACEAWERVVSLPLYPDLSEAEQDLVVERLSAAVQP